MQSTTPPPLPVRPSRHTHKVRIGQKYVLYAILINFAVFFLGMVPKDRDTLVPFAVFTGLLGLTALILGITGIITIGAGLRYDMTLRITLALLCIVPLVNLIMLLILNQKATAMLRAAGYKVGLLGAKSSRGVQWAMSK